MKFIPTFIYKRLKDRPNLLKIINNISWLILDKFFRMGVGFLILVWLARELGPEQFGLYSFATAFVGLFSTFAALGLQGIVVRNILQSPNCIHQTLGSTMMLQLASGFISYLFMLLAIFWMRPDDEMAKLIVAILGSVMLLKFSDTALYWFESQVLSKYAVWVQNGNFIVFGTIKIFMIKNGAELVAFAWTTLIEGIFSSILLITILSMRGPNLASLRVTSLKMMELLKDSWPLMLSSVAIMIYMKIDQIMLAQMLDDEAVGIYSAAIRISEIWYFIPVVIVASVFPSILNIKTKEPDIYLKRLQRLFDLMVLISVIAALTISLAATDMISIIYGSQYKEAGLVLALHSWTSIFVFLGVASGKWFIMENKQMLYLQRSMIGAFVNIALNIIMIPLWGAVGAAVATLISYLMVVFFADLINKETRFLFAMKIRSINLYGVYKRIK